MTNREYGNLDENSKIEYASSQIRIGKIYISKPTREHYAKVGMFKIDSTAPEKEGFYYIPTEFGDYVETEGMKCIKRRFEEHQKVAPEPVACRYSKLKLITAAKEIGKWESLKKFIQDSGLWDEWLVCQYLSSDHPKFTQATEAIENAGILSRDEIDQILAKSVDMEML